MVITEQKYSQKSRVYWHGQKDSKDLKTTTRWSKVPLVFLSNSVNYVLNYVDYLNNPNGTIFKCYLKTPLNIFNMRSKVDFYKLNKELNFSRMDSAIYKTLDWTYDVLSYKRDIVIDTIYDFGEYDSFFNFESLDKPENPSIGIFDKNNIILEKVWTIEEYKLINRKVFESIKNDIELKTLLEFFKANGIQLTSENSRLLKAEFYT